MTTRMELPRNRWFGLHEKHVVFKFGKYKGQRLDEVIDEKDGAWYIRHVVLEKFDDLTPGVRSFLERVLLYGHTDGVVGVGREAPVKETPGPGDRADAIADKKRLLKEKLARKKQAEEAEEKKEKLARLLQKRRDEALW